ncbi:endonuclease III domain-containing protein [Thermodesulforhabdus norvegica]|uniref:DNA-3-methyladenine glycosylase III n=1 Tax=Thermodesulforhabdus norvegica TaxID=39841 RepID=A0A1I4UBZ7_9BACT|nr:endonuclease III domain-containing protein [Thermodesulforhabdus norvegica]SFM86514.1 DNA-3-methyladenine glycosylase III [Thermodesulforhabdus norvegica]
MKGRLTEISDLPSLRKDILLTLYELLFKHFGPQNWWPAETPFEMIVGAILTQCTSWSNVEKAIDRLKSAGKLSLEALLETDYEEIEELIKPSGYFRQKAVKLKNFVNYIAVEWDGDLEAFLDQELETLRKALLNINGIGPETADSIILYAANKPIFVVDRYTYRCVYRHGWFDGPFHYGRLQSFFMETLEASVSLYQEYHALFVQLGKYYCRTKPRCLECPVGKFIKPRRTL